MGTPYEVTSVLTEKKGQPPVLVEFENGKINPEVSEPLKCKLYEDGHDPQKKYVTVENEKTTYIGCPSSADSSMHTYLAIRNRKTHKVQLVRVESARATAAVGREFQPLGNKTDGVTENSFLDLSRKFGSKASKRALEQKLRFHSVSKSDGHLDDVVKDKIIKPRDLQSAHDDGLETLLPPCNTNASSPNEVYDINDILTENERKSLQDGFEALETEEEEAFLKKCSPWFNSLVEKCMKNAEQMSLLLYAEYLIRLCNNRRTYSLFEICNCSQAIARKLNREFISKKGKERVMSSANVDKAVLRIIIINLYLSDFNIKILPLANSLKNINTARIKLLVRVSGANFGGRFSEVATLKVPIKQFDLNAIPFKKRKP